MFERYLGNLSQLWVLFLGFVFAFLPTSMILYLFYIHAIYPLVVIRCFGHELE